MRCERCGSDELIRVRKKGYERLIHLVLPVKAIRCYHCQHRTLKRHKASTH